MPEPRRRRRRGRRGRGSSGRTGGAQEREQAQPQASSDAPQRQRSGPPSDGARKRRRRRGGRSGGGGNGGIPSPKLSEDLFRLLTEEEPRRVGMLEPDGTDLDELIGELQSTWGVPQYPQEYRITLKVADRQSAPAANDEPKQERRQQNPNSPKREKAPSVARMTSNDPNAGDRPPKRRRRRRGRRSGGGNGGGGGNNGGSNPGPPTNGN
jgi:hypothetical protein